MYIELIIPVESLSTKSTLGMALETTLIDSTRVVIAELLMFPKLLCRKEFVLMCKDLLVPGTKITHRFVMYTLYMTVEVWPTPTSYIAVLVGAIVA